MLTCDASYTDIFGTFIDPMQQKLASEGVLQALLDAGIDISGIDSIEFESGSVVVRIGGDEATRAAIAKAVQEGRLQLRLPYTHRRGPSRDTAWQPLDAQQWFSWYKPELVRWEITEQLRNAADGDFNVYLMVRGRYACLHVLCLPARALPACTCVMLTLSHTADGAARAAVGAATTGRAGAAAARAYPAPAHPFTPARAQSRQASTAISRGEPCELASSGSQSWVESSRCHPLVSSCLPLSHYPPCVLSPSPSRWSSRKPCCPPSLRCQLQPLPRRHLWQPTAKPRMPPASACARRLAALP